MRAGCLSCFSFLGRRKLLAPEHAERGAHAEASLGFSPLPLPLETKHEVAIEPPVFAAPPSYPPPIAKDLGSKAMSSPEKAKIAIPGLQMSDEEPGDSEGTEHGAPRAVLTGPRDSPAESDEENFEIPEITYHVVPPPRHTAPAPAALCRHPILGVMGACAPGSPWRRSLHRRKRDTSVTRTGRCAPSAGAPLHRSPSGSPGGAGHGVLRPLLAHVFRVASDRDPGLALFTSMASLVLRLERGEVTGPPPPPPLRCAGSSSRSRRRSASSATCRSRWTPARSARAWTGVRGGLRQRAADSPVRISVGPARSAAAAARPPPSAACIYPLCRPAQLRGPASAAHAVRDASRAGGAQVDDTALIRLAEVDPNRKVPTVRRPRARPPAPPRALRPCRRYRRIELPPLLPSRTNWTRLVPRPVLTGHVSSLRAHRARARGRWISPRRPCSRAASRAPPPAVVAPAERAGEHAQGGPDGRDGAGLRAPGAAAPGRDAADAHGPGPCGALQVPPPPPPSPY